MKSGVQRFKKGFPCQDVVRAGIIEKSVYFLFGEDYFIYGRFFDETKD